MNALNRLRHNGRQAADLKLKERIGIERGQHARVGPERRDRRGADLDIGGREAVIDDAQDQSPAALDADGRTWPEVRHMGELLQNPAGHFSMAVDNKPII